MQEASSRVVSGALPTKSAKRMNHQRSMATPRSQGDRLFSQRPLETLKMPSAKIIDVVALAYKSLQQPDFAFVKKAKSQRPYESTIRRLRDYAALEQNLDTDDDVCFSFLLKGQAALWKLDLSMIGPFAIFVRLKSRINQTDFLHKATGDLSGFETKVVEILTAEGIRLMTPDELSLPVPLKLFNTPAEQVRLYQALFTDQPELPW